MGAELSGTSINCFFVCIVRDLKVVTVNKHRMMLVCWRSHTDHVCPSKRLELTALENRL